MSAEKMKVVICEPGMLARAAEIGTTLEDLQKAVGGLIEAVYPYDDPVAIVCNEEGQINGMPLNRSLRDGDGKIYDIIAGPFFVCGLGEEDFCSLSDEQIGKAGKRDAGVADAVEDNATSLADQASGLTNVVHGEQSVGFVDGLLG